MISSLSLRNGEVEQLTDVFRTTEDRRPRDSVQAILMAGRGRATDQFAEDLAVHPSTVRRWLAR